MGIPTSNHRPLRAGIAIMPSDGEEHRGTLGAIARRKSDLAKVLVTNVHVVSTHRNNYTVTGTESIYQGGTAAGDKVGQLFRHTVNGVEKKSWAEGESNENELIIYPVDAAALALPTGADVEALTSFNIHFPNDDENNHTHIEKRPIVGPAVDPTPGMKLIAVGAGGGLRTFTPDVEGTYTFTLTATDPYDLTASDVVNVRVLPASQSVIPANLSATAAARSLDISWNSVSIATGYEVQLGVRESGDDIGYASYITDALTHRVENLAPSTRTHIST